MNSKLIIKLNIYINIHNYIIICTYTCTRAQALRLAAQHGCTDCVRVLLAGGAKMESAMQRNRIHALMAAVAHQGCVRLLLESGADINFQNSKVCNVCTRTGPDRA